MIPTLKLTWIELKLFLREPMAVIFALAFPLFVLFVLAGVFGNDLDMSDEEEVRVWRGVGPTDYYVPAYIGLVMAAIGLISLPQRLTAYRERGVLRRFNAAGMPLVAVLGSQAVVATGVAIVGGASIAVVSSIVYGTQFAADWPAVTFAFAAGIVMFCALGLMLGGLLPSSRSAQGAGLILFFVMFFLAGAGPPREVLAGGVREIGSLLPLTHVVIALQDPWLGFGWSWGALAITFGFAVVSLGIAAWRFRWD